MLTASQKLLTQEAFQRIIQRTLYPGYKHTSMKAHYVVLRNFDNYDALWSKIEYFIARSLPLLQKYKLQNSLLVQDLVYYQLVPQFLSLSAAELTEISCLYAIFKISKQKSFDYDVADHFMDYTQISIRHPKHVCQLCDVQEEIEAVEFKFQQQKEGSDMSAWRYVILRDLQAIQRTNQPLCRYFAQTLCNFVSEFIHGKSEYRANQQIYSVFSALTQRGLLLDDQFDDIKAVIQCGNERVEELERQLGEQQAKCDASRRYAEECAQELVQEHGQGPAQAQKRSRHFDEIVEREELSDSLRASQLKKTHNSINSGIYVSQQLYKSQDKCVQTQSSVVSRPDSNNQEVAEESVSDAGEELLAEVPRPQESQGEQKPRKGNLQINTDSDEAWPEAISTSMSKRGLSTFGNEQSDSKRLLEATNLRVNFQNQLNDQSIGSIQQSDQVLPPPTPQNNKDYFSFNQQNSPCFFEKEE